MTDSNREHLSALMDGELDHKGSEFLLRRLSSDDDLGAQWRRYHLVRASLHKELSGIGDISSRVSAALADEPSIGRSGLPGWLKPVVGSAIAASVAMVAVIGVNNNLMEREPGALPADQPGFVSQPTALDQPFSRQATPVGFSEQAVTEERERINLMLMRHNQAIGVAGGFPYLPLVAEEAPQAEPEVDQQQE